MVKIDCYCGKTKRLRLPNSIPRYALVLGVPDVEVSLNPSRRKGSYLLDLSTSPDLGVIAMEGQAHVRR